MENNELDAQIEQRIFGHTVVPLGRAWDPSGEGYSILRPDEDHDGDLRPMWVRRCMCDLLPQHQDESKWDYSVISRESWELLAADERTEFAADRAVWGHSKHCLDVVPWYSSDISAAWRIVVQLHDRFGLVLSWNKANPSASFITMGAIITAEAETVPLAICLAALKTLE